MSGAGERDQARPRTGHSAPPRPSTDPGSGHGPGPAPTPSYGESPARHCWVAQAIDGRGVRPGLLLEWRRRDGRWEGRVVYAACLTTGWGLVQEWVPGAQLTPL